MPHGRALPAPRRFASLVFALPFVILTEPAAVTPGAQGGSTLGIVLTAFLPDSGAATRGLPWTTGSELPVQWDSPKPVAAAPHLQRSGYTLSRTAKFRMAAEGTKGLDATLQVDGNAVGVQRVTVVFPQDEITGEQVERALMKEGFALRALKCSRATEGASYGNVVYVAKVPKKQAQGLWLSWNCARDGCASSAALVYRRAELAQVECAAPG